MPDYNLAGLSARSFEQMIQALALKVIGPGIVIFGDGPDGGREATFKGVLPNFPSSANQWGGYLVVQAKFCQRPTGKPKEDANWLVLQLKKELDSYATRKTKRKRPEFYILATNVILSPVQGVGGKDSISTLIEQYRKKIGLKDYLVWDHDQICRYLDTNESIRHAYDAWITPGDVLAKLSSKLEASIADFGKVMANFLQKEILDDHFSKLEQAGHSPENRIPLEQVFVDLPAFNERRSKSPDEKTSPTGLPPGFLSEILVQGSLCLRPEESIAGAEKRIEPTNQPEPGRYVLVGGPGLGKSTLAQFLCQIQRAGLLANRGRLDRDVKLAVKSILENCTSQKLPWEMAKRFPIRVELARFAKALASQAETKVTSILSYTAFIIKDRTNYEVAAADLRKWLGKYPWIVVLDGLDEVPASSNRAQVLMAIRDFMVDVSTCDADVLVLATTRPQGYNEEFSPQRYQHRWLCPLSVPRAVHYGQILVQMTYAQNLQRKKEVLSRLENAAGIPATARLMESPLQVTIMARLLAQVAQPPQERYRLFQQYYEVIYRREMERGVEKLSQLLRDHEANIGAIHHRTGLLLQMESERTRHTDATIPIEDFKAVVAGRLSEEGFSDGALDALTELIATCATDRLVFLVPSQSERVGFEIRSLQEFMAAEALMDGSDNVVVERLRTIAPVPFWQNVLLFAAGKCFAERQWLRENIAQVCRQLDDDPGDKLSHLIMAGSRVAVSLLEDGPARRQPAYAQVLARHALALLRLPLEEAHDRIADVYEPAFETVYREELCQHLNRRDIADQVASWRVVCRLLSEKESSWVPQIAESQWPRVTSDKIVLFKNLDVLRSPWLLDRYFEIFFEIPMLLRLYGEQEQKRVQELFRNNEPILRALEIHSGVLEIREMENISFKIGKSTEARFILSSLDRSQKKLSPFLTLSDIHPYWKPLVEAARFAEKPSKDTLACALRSISTCFESTSYQYEHVFPWPLIACLDSADTTDDLLILAERAGRGEFGDLKDWLEAERRWKEKGITLEDLQHMDDDRWPIPRDIGTVGIPCLSSFWFHVSTGQERMTEMKAFLMNLPGNRAKSQLVTYFIHYFWRPSWLHRRRRAELPDSELIESLVSMVPKVHRRFFLHQEILCGIYLVIKGTDKARSIFNYLGSFDTRFYLDRESGETRSILSELSGELCNWVEQEPHLTGILSLLSGIARSLSIVRVPEIVWQVCVDEDSAASNSALLLRIAQKGLSGEIFANIGEKILSKCAEDESLVQSALGIFENHQMDNKEGIVFLETLIEQLPPNLYGARKRVVALLSDLSGRRIASICERTIWEKLCLPNGLPKLVSR